MAVFLRREGGEGFLFRGDILRVDVAGEEAVGEEDFRVGGGGGAVDVEHREVLGGKRARKSGCEGVMVVWWWWWWSCAKGAGRTFVAWGFGKTRCAGL